MNDRNIACTIVPQKAMNSQQCGLNYCLKFAAWGLVDEILVARLSASVCTTFETNVRTNLH